MWWSIFGNLALNSCHQVTNSQPKTMSSSVSLTLEMKVKQRG
jgi:hypothetical protein